MPRRWYRILKAFMSESKARWARRYPEFRSHGDGDKLAAYKLVCEAVGSDSKLAENQVLIPKRYKKLRSVWALSSDILRKIEADAFVIKAILGNQGRRVICLHRKRRISDNVMMYRDILRHKSYNMNLGQTISYITHMLKRDENAKGSALLIEEFLGDPHVGLPVDYKLYTVKGKVRLISIFGRRGRDEYAVSYDKNWNLIPMSKIYRHPAELEYIEESLEELPSDNIRKELIELAEKLAKAHHALFCRYDFYVIKDKIYFGEITPVCGDLNNYRVRDEFARTLCPEYEGSDSDSSPVIAHKHRHSK